MAATMEVTLEDVLSSIDNLLMETEIQDNNSDLGFHEEARTSPLQTRNGSIFPACNTWYRTGFRQERWSSLRWAVWFDYRHIPIPGSKSKPNETKDCKFVRFWIVRDDSFRKPRKSVED